jgi:DNA mismatch repair protein MutS2
VSRPAEQILEFDRLRDLLRGRTTSAPGRRSVDALAFGTDRTQLEHGFAAIAEAVAYLRTGSEIGFGALADPQPWLERIGQPGAVLVPAVLEPTELLNVLSLVDTAAWLGEVFRETAPKFPLLTERARSLADFRPLGMAIRRAILPNGEVSDDASSELRRIRGGLARTRETIQSALERILRSRGAPQGEDYVTRRNDRFVIPVRASDRRSVEGVVHASSATGQTVFVEPLETLELNNRLVQLSDEELKEIARILEELTGRVATEHPALSRAVDTIAELDSLFARARFARDFDACMPVFTDTATIALELARHPVLENTLRPQGRAIVPMTLALGGDETVLVISGPNTGGKTVALKTVGLAVLAAQSGIPVAAQSARLPLFDQVLADIGDEQSIAADLSTFSAHVLNLKSMLASLTERSLVLVDEMGTGTAPEEGAALAVALLDEFRARRCLVLATTHHDRLKAYASNTPGVLNASVEFDDVKLAPTYRLRVGVPGGSSGIAIARRLGLPSTIVDRASALIAPEAHEAAALIAYLHRSRDAVEQMQRDLAEQSRRLDQEKRALREEWVERQRKRIAELEQRVADALAQNERDVSRILEAVQDRELRAQLEKQTRRGMGKARSEMREEVDAAVVAQLSESQPDLGIAVETQRPPAPSELVPGARLRVRGFSAPVVLLRCDASSAEVQAGPLRMKVPLAEVTAVVTGEPVTTAAGTLGKRPGASSGAAGSSPAARPPINSVARQGSTTVHAAAASEDAAAAPDEINVIGCTVDEATRLVDKFLDTAALGGKPRVRVIHGHGTGALRRGLAEFFSSHPLVESIHAEEAERGGAAVTVVELKD